MSNNANIVLLDVADLQKLETLREIVFVTLDPSPWTDKRAERIRQLTGKDAITYHDIWEMAREANCERY